MPYGLTSSGFILKSLADIKLELEALYRATFGAGIKTTEDTVFGKLIGIQAEREAEIWELMQATYSSQYPATGSDISLDRIGEITSVIRNAATASEVVVFMAGTDTTSIPADTLFSVQDSDEQFKTLAAINLSGSNFSITSITSAAGVATATTPAPHGRLINTAVFINGANETEYNGLIAISSVPTPTTFQYSVAGSPASPATGTIDADPTTAMICESVTLGAIQALAGTLTNIVTNISGLDRVENYFDAIVGNNKETDSEFRVRRINALKGVAAARLEGIRSYLLAVANVTSVTVFENTSLVVDGAGRPAKSIECMVLGGTDQDILDAAWDRKAGGIELYGNVSGTVTDSQGESHASKFSRPTSANIWLELDLTIDADFPTDGDDLVEQAVLDYASTLEIGEDVIVFPYLITSFGDIAGITDVVVRIDDAAAPTTDANIVIGDTALAIFDTSRITIAHI